MPFNLDDHLQDYTESLVILISHIARFYDDRILNVICLKIGFRNGKLNYIVDDDYESTLCKIIKTGKKWKSIERLILECIGRRGIRFTFNPNVSASLLNKLVQYEIWNVVDWITYSSQLKKLITDYSNRLIQLYRS